MGFLLSLVIKNLLRHKRRTLITAISIAVGIWAYVFMDSMVQSMVTDSLRALTEYETGFVKVLEPGYWEEREFMPMDIVIEDPATTVETLERAGIRAVPRTRFAVELLVYEDPYPRDVVKQVIGYGIDPSGDSRVFNIEDSLVEGEWLENGRYGAVIGTKLAEKLGAEIGYPLLVKTRTRYGSFQTIDLEIIGLVDTPNPYMDKYALFVPLDVADEALEMEGAVTEVATKFPLLTDETEASAEVLAALGPDYDTKNWAEIDALQAMFSMMAATETDAIAFLIFIIAAVGISNTMLNAVYERHREIGMMRAMGMGDRKIVTALALEGAGIGVVGAVLGLLLSLPSLWWLIEVGLDYNNIMPDMDWGIRSEMVFFGVWNPSTMVTAAIVGIVASGIVAIFPSRRAVKHKIVDNLRSD